MFRIIFAKKAVIVAKIQKVLGTLIIEIMSVHPDYHSAAMKCQEYIHG